MMKKMADTGVLQLNNLLEVLPGIHLKRPRQTKASGSQ
jgi:hypothetical protein